MSPASRARDSDRRPRRRRSVQKSRPRGRPAVLLGPGPAGSRHERAGGNTPAEQATRCLQNLESVCAAAGASLGDAVRCTVYLTDLPGAFGEVNEAYGEFFASDPPARVAIGVAALPKGALVEIDAIVALPG